MLNISEELQKNIEDIVAQVRDVERKLKRADTLDAELTARIAFSCTEIALLAFAASDELNEEGTIGDRLLQREISSALWSIALSCVEVQTWQNESMIRMNAESMSRQCTAVVRMMGIPEPVPEEALMHRASEELSKIDRRTQMQTVTPAVKLEPLPDIGETALSAAPPPEDEIARLKIEIKALREILAALVLKRDNLLLVESKELESLYMKELGYLELEVYAAESRARYLQRKYEMMQAAMNRRQPINTPEIEKKLNEKAEEFKKVYEEFRKKAKEAEESVRKRRRNAQNASDGLGKEGEKTQKAGPEDDEDKKKQLPPGEEGSPEKEETAEEKGVSRLKKLYRRIVKAMHPDLHPDQDEKTKELFKRAMAAYEEGDLQTLEEIAQIIDGDEPENAEDLLTALLKEKERLLSLIRGIREQIALILSRYPFTKRDLLHDPVRLKAEQEKLKARLERAKEREEAYRRKIEELEKHGRADRKTE